MFLALIVACGGNAESQGVNEAPQTQQTGDTAAPGPTQAPALNAKTGGFITMLQYADVRQRLIHESSALNMNMSPMFNKLMEFNPETDDPTDIRCDLCTDWELAEDGTTYTFHVAEKAKWWDGEPVTSEDVVFSFKSILNPDQFQVLEGRSTSSSLNFGLYMDEGVLRAVDGLTVEVPTKFPSDSSCPPFPSTPP